VEWAAVDFFWIPLGAGGHSVRINGILFEAIDAAVHRRSRCDLYHSALEVTVDGNRYTIELAPVWNERSPERGVVAQGAVGSRFLGRLALFRYELRCWRDGRIPDLADAVGGAQRLSTDPECARRVLALAPTVPTPVWGRDELGLGEMWNCNSVIAWLLARAGVEVGSLHPPPGGRAPGWHAGETAALSPG
jgi:hypothetical protein